MANFFEDNDDLQYYFDKGIDWEPLVRLIEHDFKAPEGFADVDEAKATYRDMLAMIGELAADEISPRSPEIDREGARMVGAEAELPGAINEIFERFKELELHGLAIPRELGGFSCPMVVHYLASELLATNDEVLLVGDGARRYSEVFEGLARVEHAEIGNSYPSASSLVQLAHPRAMREEFEQPEALGPIYLRRPDAEINWSTRNG